ncbi:MAG: CoA-binding protein, partial [Nostocoides sp.]
MLLRSPPRKGTLSPDHGIPSRARQCHDERRGGGVMTTMATAAAVFLANRRIAVTGVSHAPKGHGSNAVYTWLREHGYEVFAINPEATQVE